MDFAKKPSSAKSSLLPTLFARNKGAAGQSEDGGTPWACVYAKLGKDKLTVAITGKNREGTMVNILEALGLMRVSDLTHRPLPSDQGRADDQTVLHMNPDHEKLQTPEGDEPRKAGGINIHSSRTDVLDEAFVSALEVKGSPDDLEALKTRLDRLPPEQPPLKSRDQGQRRDGKDAPALSTAATTRKTASFRQALDIDLEIPQDGSGILHAFTSILWHERVNIISLDSDSFEDENGTPMNAYIRARVQLQPGADVDAFQLQVTERLMEENPSWNPYIRPFGDGTRSGRSRPSGTQD